MRAPIHVPHGSGIAAITLFALVVRLWGIDSLGDLDFDEQASSFIGSMPPGEMLAYLLAAPFEHPPVFYLVFHVWLAVAGDSETAMRVFAALAGAAAVGVVGAATAGVAGPRAGAVAAFVLATLPLHVYHSRDARMYTLLTLLLGLMLLGLVLHRDALTPTIGGSQKERGPGPSPLPLGEAGRSPPTRRGARAGEGMPPLLLAFLAGLGALATHYYAAFPVLGVVLGGRPDGSGRADRAVAEPGSAGRQGRRPLRRHSPALALAGIVALLGGAAWFTLASGLRSSLSVFTPRLVAPGELAGAVVGSLGAPVAGPLAPGWVYGLAAGFVGVVVAWSLGGLLALHAATGDGVAAVNGAPGVSQSKARPSGRHPSRSPPFRAASPQSQWSRLLRARSLIPNPHSAFFGRVVVSGLLAASLGIPLLMFLGRPFAPRFAMLATPFLAVLVGLVAARLSGRWLLLGGALYGALVVVALVPMYTGYVRSDYGEAMAVLRAQVRADDAIILNGPWQDLLYRRYGWGLPPRHIIASTVPLEPNEAVPRLAQLAAAHPRLWVVDAATDAADPTGVVAGWLDANAYPRPVIEYRKALLRPYLTEQPRGPTLQSRALDLTALDVRIETVALESWALAPGAEARLRLQGQRTAERGQGPGGIVTRLVSPQGVDVWHWDGALAERSRQLVYRAALVVPSDAAAGDYRLEVVVYRADLAPDGSRRVADLSEPIPLGLVHVS